MKNFSRVCYGITIALTVILLTIIAFHESTDRYYKKAKPFQSTVQNYEYRVEECQEGAGHVKSVYQWEIGHVPENGASVSFYESHQIVRVYLNDELVYSLSPSSDNWIGRTTGSDICTVYLYPKDVGKTIQVEMIPIYKGLLSENEIFYVGESQNVILDLVRRNIPLAFLSVLAMVVGVVYIGYVVINIHNRGGNRNLLTLGIFIFLAGLWKLSDSQLAPLVFSNSLFSSNLSILCVSLMVPPCFAFVYESLRSYRQEKWNIVSICCSILCTSMILVQMLGQADLRETLILGHIMIAITLLAVVIMLIQERRMGGWNASLKVSIACSVGCILGIVIDLYIFYITNQSSRSVFCILSFIIYGFVMGVMQMKEAKELMKKGHQAAYFENIAHHDSLTGLYNRSFYAEYMKKHHFERTDSIVVMFDVNNLKLCNDTYGHSCGDLLIRYAANLISETFSERGKCFRMGGDEFCVILRKKDLQECVDLLNKFDQAVIDFNNNSTEEFLVQVAYGYAYYDSDLDFDFSDTMRRADKMMYQKKEMMKKNEV